MIQTYTYRAELRDRDFDEVSTSLKARVALISRNRSALRGASVARVNDVVELRMRMSGLDRWRIAEKARKLGTFLLAFERLGFVNPLQPWQVVTEPNKRHLTFEQGRTPRDNPGRGRGRRSTDGAVEEPDDGTGSPGADYEQAGQGRG